MAKTSGLIGTLGLAAALFGLLYGGNELLNRPDPEPRTLQSRPLTEVERNKQAQAGRYEILFFNTRSCGWCKKFRKEDMPKWEQSDTANYVTLRPLNPNKVCNGSGKYGDVCRSVYEKGGGVPAFALVDTKDMRIMEDGMGIPAFYKAKKHVDRRLKYRPV